MKLPKARTGNLLEQNLEKETLIYDLSVNKAFNLNETSTIVYRACNDETTFDELKRRHKFTDDFIYFALDELKRNNLLAGEYRSPFVNTNRREIIKKVGLGTMFALPIITGLVAPGAARAASGGAGGSGDASRGNYDQACILDSFYPPRCNGDLRCYPTTSGEQRCCEFSSAAGTRHYSGESRTQTNGPIYTTRAGAVTSDNTSCRYNLTCCDGRAAIGTCTYAPDTTNEYGPADYENFERTGQYPYLQTCTCTCP